jgi:hypothetical protein
MVERLPVKTVEETLTEASEELIEYLQTYGFEPSRLRPSSLSHTIRHWQLCSASCGWMKFLKYKYAAFFAHHLGGEVPLPPFTTPDHPSHLMGGSAGRFIRKMLLSPKALQFAIGVLYLKKGAPRPDQAALLEGKKKAFKALTTKQPPPPPFILPDGTTFSLLDLKEQIRRTCVELTRDVVKRGVRVDESILHKPFAPSIRANFERGRHQFGTLGSLSSVLPMENYDDLTAFRLTDPETFEELGLDPTPDPRRGVMEYRDSVVPEDQSHSVAEDESRDNVPDEIPLKLSSSWAASFKQFYSSLYEEVRKKARGQPFSTKLVALAEALKIRVISKGPPLKYFLLKPLQKFLSKLLGRFPCFRLTRQTINADFLTRFFNDRPSPPMSSPDVWNSLDYEGATDNINPFASECCVDDLNELLEVPSDIGEDFKSSLTGHTVEDPKTKKQVPQQWGQFMGSIMSFVVLCIVNMAVIRRSYELTVLRRVSLRRIPALVNGDDGLVRAPASFLPIWKGVARVAGLIPSLGKVYSHPTYANMNSTSYSWSFDSSEFIFEPYVNMGLIYGMQRSTDKSSPADAFDSVDSRHASIGSRHTTLIESCPPDLRIRVHDAFLRHNRPLLKSLPGLPLYVPTVMGGLGLCPIPDPSSDDLDTPPLYGPLPWQLAAMEFLENNPNSYRISTLPTDVPIQVRSLWTKFIPYHNSRQKPTSYNMTQDDIGLLDVSTYYLCPSLVAHALKKDPLQILRRNQRVWRSLKRRFCPPSVSPADALD